MNARKLSYTANDPWQAPLAIQMFPADKLVIPQFKPRPVQYTKILRQLTSHYRARHPSLLFYSCDPSCGNSSRVATLLETHNHQELVTEVFLIVVDKTLATGRSRLVFTEIPALVHYL